MVCILRLGHCSGSGQLINFDKIPPVRLGSSLSWRRGPGMRAPSLTFRKSFVDERHATACSFIAMVEISVYRFFDSCCCWSRSRQITCTTRRLVHGHDLRLWHVSLAGGTRNSPHVCVRHLQRIRLRVHGHNPADASQRIFSFYYFLFSSLYLTSFALIGCAIVVELERTARDLRQRKSADPFE